MRTRCQLQLIYKAIAYQMSRQNANASALRVWQAAVHALPCARDRELQDAGTRGSKNTAQSGSGAWGACAGWSRKYYCTSLEMNHLQNCGMGM
jgi:hypothetical protein